MSQSNKDSNKPIIEYRVELEKRIQINKSFSQRRNQAVAMRILSYGLFGQKRYQNLYLTCSLNCFHLALKIANQIHQRVAGLAMIIKFQTVQVLEYFAKEFNGKYFEEKKYSKILIKLTKNPTQEDKKEPGYVLGLKAEQIQEPLNEVLARKKKDRSQRQNQSQNQNQRQNNQNYNNNSSQNMKKYKPREDQQPKKRYRESKFQEVKNNRRQSRSQSQANSQSTSQSQNQQYQRNERKTRGNRRENNNSSRRQQPQYRQVRAEQTQRKNQPRPNQDQNRGRRQPRNRYDDEDDN